jgi:hypothetical protein
MFIFEALRMVRIPDKFQEMITDPPFLAQPFFWPSQHDHGPAHEKIDMSSRASGFRDSFGAQKKTFRSQGNQDPW